MRTDERADTLTAPQMASSPLGITFLLPAFSGRPVGGYAVVYEYASRLARRGHQVTVEHATWWAGRPDLKMVTRCLARRLRRISAAVSWFPLDARVRVVDRLIWRWRKSARDDILVATAWQTAERLGRVPSLGGRGCYLIQSYETWSGPKSRVDRTFRLPLRRAAIAPWLVALVAEAAPGPCQLVPNAIDTSVFRLVNPIAQRSSNEVAMLWHEMPAKGSRYGLEALKIAQRSCPNLHVTLFSAHRRPADLPDWITFVENASRSTVSEILNRAAVFISPSLYEGWPLPPAEALACGAALLSTDIPAVRDYAKDRETAILVPRADPSTMAVSLIRLLRDTAERTKIASQGHDFVTSHFDWERSTDLLERMFRDGSFSA